MVSLISTSRKARPGSGVSPAGRSGAGPVLGDSRHRTRQFTKCTWFHVFPADTSKALRTWLSVRLENTTLPACRKTSLGGSSLCVAPPPGCLQNGAADNVCGTSTRNRTLHFTGTAGKPALLGKSKKANGFPHSDQDALTLLATTEAFPVTAKAA